LVFDPRIQSTLRALQGHYPQIALSLLKVCSTLHSIFARWIAPMAESDRDPGLRQLRREPGILANIPPSSRQRQAARGLILVLLAILLATWPFATLKLPSIQAFVPSLAAALFVSDCVTAVLLFGQFSILRHWSLYAIASGYLFSALMVVAHALAFPGAFSGSGLFSAGLQSAVWLYWSWHSGLPLAIIAYVPMRDSGRLADPRSIRSAITIGVIAVAAFVLTLFWFIVRYHDLLPITFVDVHPISFFRRVIGGLVILTLGGMALYLLWTRRRTLLDEWLMVALCALLIEVTLASVLSGDRYTVSWYAGRFYQLITATAVMVVLLAETTALYANLARTNASLLQERLLLQRAMHAHRREREARLVTGDAVAAAIAHEIKQPLATMITRSETSLRWLDRSVPEIQKAREALKHIAAEGQRAAVIVDSIRANFRNDDRVKSSLDINDLIQDSVGLAHDDLHTHRIEVEAAPNPDEPRVIGDRIQLQQVLVNLITNAIESMKANEGARVLRITSEVSPTGEVEVSVKDSGAGISPQHISNVFNPLFTTKSDGMGMGLSICRSIVEAHNGRLWAVHNTPEGAVLRFALPAESAAAINAA
jgi:signal transduction histidine kinase